MNRIWVWGLMAGALIASGLWYWMSSRAIEARFVRAWPDEIIRDPAMMAFGESLAAPLYKAHCASCHGDDRKGNWTLGAPDLSDSVWLYGDGSIGDIERTILYGVRSGHPKTHRVTDMPAIGRTHQLTSEEVGDVVEYVLQLSRRPRDQSAADRGQRLFNGKGNCFDCHGGNAKGNPDYGSPALTGPAWIFGGDRLSLRQSIYNGRHGLCPAWIGRLSAVQIRSLAVSLYADSHSASASRTSTSP